MGNQAHVSSTEALDSFRARLIVFLSKANRSVNDVNDEVRRTRLWLQHDQRLHWESELRKRSNVLDQAEQELMSARLSKHQETALLVRQAAVRKAKQKVSEAQDKLRRLKIWNQNFDSTADPIVKRLESLRHVLDEEMPKAIAYLVNVQRTLDAYASAPIGEAAPSATAAGEIESKGVLEEEERPA